MKIWYAYLFQKLAGPFTKEQVIQQIQKGGITPTDFISLGVKDNWKLPTEWSCFPHSLFPAYQGVDANLSEPKKAEWIVLSWDTKDRQYLHTGPFTVEEVKNKLLQKKLDLFTYLWKPGLSGWAQARHRPEFSIINPTRPAAVRQLAEIKDKI